ncbi:hypothetical protein BUALT_Bualt03G0195600 [Buddleja alternifolia]|uniref:Uncharacterized protein n=1 Tax=Buddleja alternifolia TaxID=168488 RepID=A0AAV6Y384_9LAMI|nr:hypothetical protein BUALT_Bualt03G0195600 [Buddleja alternifolia]
MNRLVQTAPLPKICARYGCCVGAECSKPNSCFACFYKNKLKNEFSFLLNNLVMEITGLHFYGDLILFDPDVCLHSKFSLALFVIETFKKQSRRQSPFPRNMYRKPDFLGIVQPANDSMSNLYREIKLSDVERPESCCFFQLRDHVYKMLQEMLSNLHTSSQTMLQLYSNPCFGFLNELKEEIDAARSDPEDSPRGSSEEPHSAFE